MVKVRLARRGAKKRPFYHLVVTDKENPRDGSFIEQIGIYDPSRPITEARVNHQRLSYWVGVGAKMSDRVRKVVKMHAKEVGTQPMDYRQKYVPKTAAATTKSITEAVVAGEATAPAEAAPEAPAAPEATPDATTETVEA